MAPELREKVFQIRLSEDERRKLEAIAELQGLTASDAVRQWIRRDHARLIEGLRPDVQSGHKIMIGRQAWVVSSLDLRAGLADVFVAPPRGATKAQIAALPRPRAVRLDDLVYVRPGIWMESKK